MYNETVWHFASKERLDKIYVLFHGTHHLQYYFQMFWDSTISAVIQDHAPGLGCYRIKFMCLLHLQEKQWLCS